MNAYPFRDRIPRAKERGRDLLADGHASGLLYLRELQTMNERFFSRERAAGYDPAILNTATVLVVGAGALGQNVSVNLALSQVGTLLLVDLDDWEMHNATRSMAFPSPNERKRWGTKKSAVVAHKLRQMTSWSPRPHIFYATKPIQALGDAPFRHAAAVVSAVDNQPARNHIGSKAAQYSVPLVEGGFEGPRMSSTILLNDKAEAACWNCNIYDDADRNKAVQLGCTRVARQAEEAGFIPAIQPVAAYQGAFLSEAAIQLLHGNTQLGNRQVFMNIRSAAATVAELQLNPSCRHHPVRRKTDRRLKLPSAATCRDLLVELAAYVAHPVVQLPFNFLVRVACAQCKQPISVNEPEWILANLLFCKDCGGEWSRANELGNEIYPTLSEDIEPLFDLPVDKVGLVAGSVVEVKSDGKEVMIEVVPTTEAMQRMEQLQTSFSPEQGHRSPPAERRTLVEALSLVPPDMFGSKELAVSPTVGTMLPMPIVHSLNALSGDTKMNVTFTNPNGSDCFLAQVAPTRTASQCIEALMSEGLLGPARYHLVVNGKVMRPNQTLKDVGVPEGGTIAIQKMEEGA